MIKVNWKNTAENLGISIITFISGAFTCYFVMSKTVDSTANRILKANNEVIMEAIKKETTSITNEFKTHIKKLKNRKGSVSLDTRPILENKIHLNPKDTLTEAAPKALRKESFFKRLFKRKKDKQ